MNAERGATPACSPRNGLEGSRRLGAYGRNVTAAHTPRLALKCGLLLATINLLAGNIGELSPSLRTAVSLALWLPALLSLTLPGFIAAGWSRRAIGLVVLLPLAAGFHAGALGATFAVALTLWLPSLLAPKSASAEPGLNLLQLGAALAGLAVLIRESFPQAFGLFEQLSTLTCALSSL